MDHPVNTGRAEEVPFKEVAVEDLPLFIVITCLVFDVGLPRKEFGSAEEFEEYLREYAAEKFPDPARRERFIKKHLDTAIYLDDEIAGERAWQFNGEVRFKNARACGFGILKAQPGQFFMFQTDRGADPPCQLAAYQALTYGRVNRDFLPLITSREGRDRLKKAVGPGVYSMVAEALGMVSC